MTDKHKNQTGPFEHEDDHDGDRTSGRKSLCDSCNFNVDSRLSYVTILKFCQMHMESNPGHKAAPLEAN